MTRKRIASTLSRRIRLSLLSMVLFYVIGCSNFVQETTAPIVTSFPPPKTPTDETQWSIYDADPQHLWNRLFRQLFRRTTNDNKEYGWDSLDPLLWPETTHLLEDSYYEQTIKLLDEFLASQGENLITDPLKKGMFQRDLWAIFDWLNLQKDNHAKQRRTMQERIVHIMKRLALTEQEIRSLPDTYSTALAYGVFPQEFQAENPTVAFLPANLLTPESGWICIGREDGPIAMSHTEGFPFLGRSVFLIFMRVPEGRDATLSFVQELNQESSPRLPTGLEVALVRRTVLIDQQGSMVFSPIVETVQLRHFQPLQRFYAFGLNRTLLFANVSGGMKPMNEEISLFFSHGDVFLMGAPIEAEIPGKCMGCHIDDGQGIWGIKSILSYSRARFPLEQNAQPTLVQTTPEQEAGTIIAWKMQQANWQRLQVVWRSIEP